MPWWTYKRLLSKTLAYITTPILLKLWSYSHVKRSRRKNFICRQLYIWRNVTFALDSEQNEWVECISDTRSFIKGLQNSKHEHTSVQSLIKNTFTHAFQLCSSQCQNSNSSRFLNPMSHNSVIFHTHLCDESMRYPWRPAALL